jgi:hypothetical protein
VRLLVPQQPEDESWERRTRHTSLSLSLSHSLSRSLSVIAHPPIRPVPRSLSPLPNTTTYAHALWRAHRIQTVFVSSQWAGLLLPRKPNECSVVSHHCLFEWKHTNLEKKKACRPNHFCFICACYLSSTK